MIRKERWELYGLRPESQCSNTATRNPRQCTMFTAMAGVIDLVVFFPAGKMRRPRMTPTLLLKLYSTAGARPKAWLDPELSRMGWVGSEMLYPLTGVLYWWR